MLSEAFPYLYQGEFEMNMLKKLLIDRINSNKQGDDDDSES